MGQKYSKNTELKTVADESLKHCKSIWLFCLYFHLKNMDH